MEGFDSVVDDTTDQHEKFAMLSKVSGAVMVVQLNLNAIVIEEKRVELIVLMINGFSREGADAWTMGTGLIGVTILAYVLGKIALRRIRKFKLTEINGQ